MLHSGGLWFSYTNALHVALVPSKIQQGRAKANGGIYLSVHLSVQQSSHLERHKAKLSVQPMQSPSHGSAMRK